MISTLEVENIKKHYRTNSWHSGSRIIKAVDNISFKVDAGKTLAIVGESGSGKSSLARQLVGAEKPTSGKVLINGRDIYQLKLHEQNQLLLRVRMIFQNPFGSLNPRSRIGTTLEEPLKINTRLSSKERKEVVSETLSLVGLRPEHASRYPHMFSGGQRQRIAIARALILRPDVIVADEPLSALDVSVQAQILNLLMDLQEELKLSYIFISHDLGVVEHISDQVLVMYRGQVMEYGEVGQIFDSPKHPYTRTLLASTPTYRNTVSIKSLNPVSYAKKSKTNDGCVFSYRCPYATEQCVSTPPKTRNIASQLVNCHSPLE